MSTTVAIIPAAGASTRLGQPKQLVVFMGETLVQRAVNLALRAGCTRVVVVQGAVPLAVKHAEVVTCERWKEGPGASLKTGLTRVGTQAGVLVLLADQWRIEAAQLAQLIDSGAEVAAAAYAGIVGVPAWFPPSRAHVLRSLDDAQGARRWLASNADLVRAVAMPEAEEDLDTPEALERLRAEGA